MRLDGQGKVLRLDQITNAWMGIGGLWVRKKWRKHTQKKKDRERKLNLDNLL